MSRFIPYGRQHISKQDIEAVIETLQSEWITQGPTISRFEQAVADYCGVRHAVAVSNATAALHIALLALGLGPGDRLWTSPNTFVASANCARYCGADVDFVDIDPRTYNMSIDSITKKLADAKKSGHLPKIVIPVHFSGQSCEMATIQELAQHYGFAVIEDASHAIGAQYRNRPVGSCSYSDMAVFSFHPVKIITTGEGGMVVTNQKALYEKLIRLRSHGITHHSELMSEPPHGLWYYQQIELGFNYRLTDIQAALGISQLQRLDQFVMQRRELAKRYDAMLQGLPLVLPYQHPDSYSSWHLYVVRLKQGSRARKKEIFANLRQAGIGVQVHYIPVHTQPYYQSLGFRWGDFPESEDYYQEALTLPLYPDLTQSDQDMVISKLSEIV